MSRPDQDQEESTSLWKEISRKLAWAVLSTFPVADREKVRRWARGVGTGMVARYTRVYGADREIAPVSARTGHNQDPVDKRASSTDNGRAVEGERLVIGWHPVPTTGGLPFATGASLWVQERVRVWSELYGCGLQPVAGRS